MFMKIVIIVAAVMALVFAAISANAQTQSAATSGMGGAEQALLAKGNAKGADRIARAKCFSGTGACNEKYGAQRAR
jgi:hypothetical protein